MKNRMLSKRVYFTVSSLMMLVLFMFQFSGIIRKKYNNFDENKYAVSEKNDLNNNNVFTVLTDEDKVVKSISGYIVYIGDINTKTGNTVYEWCNYTKRNLLVYKTVSQYHRYNEKYPDVDIVVTKELYQEILKFVTEDNEIQCEQFMNGLLFKLKEDSNVKLH